MSKRAETTVNMIKRQELGELRIRCERLKEKNDKLNQRIKELEAENKENKRLRKVVQSILEGSVKIPPFEIPDTAFFGKLDFRTCISLWLGVCNA